MRVLVTGASGFVGRALLARLLAEPSITVRAAVRGPAATASMPVGVECCEVGDLGPHTDWRAAVADVDLVLHCAARVHVLHEVAADPLAAFLAVNRDATLTLGRAAAAAGCRRLVFLSTVKVNGEVSQPGRPFRADDLPAPQDAYARSKLEAESGLQEVAAQTGMEVVIVRPPLVYGPGVKGNFLSMMRILRAGWPLPLGAVDNRRSLIAVDNLADLVLCCARHPAAAGQVFMAADGEDLSTTELLHRLGRALGRRPRLLPVPVGLLRTAAAMLGRSALAQRLCASLQVDAAPAGAQLGWSAPLAVDAALAATASDFLARERQ